jgi:quinoprotein glucose dehydrogenase
MEGIAPSLPMLIGVGGRLSKAQIVDMIQNGKNTMPPRPMCRGRIWPRCCGTWAWLREPPRRPSMPALRRRRYTFTGYRKFLDPDGYPAIAPPWGTLNAIDLKTGKYVGRFRWASIPNWRPRG